MDPRPAVPSVVILGGEGPLSNRIADAFRASGQGSASVNPTADAPADPTAEPGPAPYLGVRSISAREGLEDRLREALGPQNAERAPRTVVYLAEQRLPTASGPDLHDAESVFELCAELEVNHLLVVSSAAVDEPSHHHPGYLVEGRRAPRRLGNPIPDLWLELERLARQLFGGRRLTLLRPSAVLVPGGRDFWSRLFRRRWALTLPGFDPTLQLLSADDLARALVTLWRADLDRSGMAPKPSPSTPEEIAPGEIAESATEVFHLAPSGAIPLSRALASTGTLRLSVPRSLQWPARKLLAPFGLAAPIEQLDYLRYPWTVSAEKIRRRHGFEPHCSSAAALRALHGTAESASESAAESAARDDADRFDPFGLDRGYVRRLSATLFRFLRDTWWRIEHRGLHHVPSTGPAVLTGVHRGFQPWDGVMAMDLVARQRGRQIRFLTHPSLLKFPFLAPYMIKMGGVPANRTSGDWVLEQGEIMAIFPEGIRGAFRLYGPDIYRIGKMGRAEYVRFALRHRAPIVPFVTVGSAEIFPIWKNLHWPWWQRLTEWPCFPLTPTLGTVPLPSKWHTVFLEPISTEGYGPDAEHDRDLVAQLSALVVERMQSELDRLQARRRWRFWGSLFDHRERGTKGSVGPRPIEAVIDTVDAAREA